MNSIDYKYEVDCVKSENYYHIVGIIGLTLELNNSSFCFAIWSLCLIFVELIANIKIKKNIMFDIANPTVVIRICDWCSTNQNNRP